MEGDKGNPMKEVIDTNDLAELLGVSTRTVKEMRACGTGPSFFLLGPRMVRYRSVDVQTYLDRVVRYSNTAEAHFGD